MFFNIVSTSNPSSNILKYLWEEPKILADLLLKADEKDIKELKSDMKVGDYRDVESARREGKQKAAEVDFIILGKQIGENEYEAKLYKGKEEVDS